jgi:hypothetical protein
VRWIRTVYVTASNQFYDEVDEPVLEEVAALLHIELAADSGGKRLGEIVNWAAQDDEQFLDILHYTLQLSPRVRGQLGEHLEALLAGGGSVWSATVKGLARRVDPAAEEAFSLATAIQDSASKELLQAWTKAYGRDSDASDAWDHAIKAVEAVLIPIVVPGQDSAHIGHVIGQLDRQGAQWKTLLSFNQPVPPVYPPHNSVQALVGMLRLLYPNPDRHIGPDHRVPTLDEARAVVQLAVTIVQWARDGQIVRKWMISPVI